MGFHLFNKPATTTTTDIGYIHKHIQTNIYDDDDDDGGYSLVVAVVLPKLWEPLILTHKKTHTKYFNVCMCVCLYVDNNHT